MSKHRLLLTGASGFVGQHVLGLREELLTAHGVTLAACSERLQLLDPGQVRREIAAQQPTVVLHLAAQSNVPAAFADPTRTLGVNILGLQNLIDAIRAMDHPARLVFVSSGDVYGHVPAEDLPIHESREPQPRNPYAVSKRAGELLVQQWCWSHDFDAVIARAFNHIGPGQAESFAISGFARQIAAIRRGLQPPVIHVGDLTPTRDFTDVRDVVRAYATLAFKAEAGGIFNVCSGVETSLATMLDELITLSGGGIEVQVDPARLRPNEQQRAAGDASRLKALGWQPRHSLRDSLTAVLEDWERRLSA